MIRRFLFLTFPAICLGKPITPEQLEFFESRIRPILAQDCYECHRTGGKKKGGLALDHRAAMEEGGDTNDLFDFANPEQSYLIKVLRHEEEGMEMPKDGVKLDERVVDDFVKWIKMGAPDPRDEPPSDEELQNDLKWEEVRERRKQWWSFQPIRKVTPPPGDGAIIDRFIDDSLKAAGLQAVEQADDRTLVRRLSFALRGLPPTVDEVNSYLADKEPDRWARLTDRFLDTPEFGERWARHWMDWIRYADSHGSEGDPDIRSSWRYRDYLIRALNNNVSYDTLVREHLAGDLLKKPRIEDGINESAIGPGHLRMVFHGFAPTDALDEKVRFTDDQINVVTKAFQGLTVSCARCHNHKFDAISQEDYYALFGIFGSTKPGVVRIDSVDEASLRNEMRDIKKQAWQQIIKGWHMLTPTLSERFFKLPELNPKNDEALFLQVWSEGNENFAAYLKPSTQDFGEKTPYRWRGEGLSEWTKHGEAKKATFSIAPDGNKLLSAIHPPGLTSRELSTKDRGILISPRIELEGDEELWIRVRGDGNAVVRYVVQNYPRNGTVFPSTTLKGGKWRWIRQNLDYWEGDRIHLEITTSRDQAILSGNDERSWFEVSEAMVVKKGQLNPAEEAKERMKTHLRSLWKDADSNQQFFTGILEDALNAAQQNRLNEQQAIILDDLLQLGLLPNDSELGTWALLYREKERQIAVPVRAPGVWEADAHDQEFYDRGNHKKPKHLVKRRFLEALDPTPYQTSLSGRLELADNFLRPDNPFTARVIVNRIWHHLFGSGLVRTTDNFGRLGEKPSHPELLDHLAAEFVTDGWNLQNLIRGIVTTKTWRRSSVPGPGAREKDPDNRMLSHFTLRRLDAEAIRDSLLAISDSLDEGRYRGGVDGKSRRRSVYVAMRRNRLDPFLQTFNAPVPLGGKGRREETNVPAQSLTLLNSKWVSGLASQWAGSMEGETAREKVRHAYETAFSRPPSPEELDAALAFMKHMDEERKKTESRMRAIDQEIREASAEIAKMEALGRSGLDDAKAPQTDAPKPLAFWDFEGDAEDRMGQLHGKLHGGAKIEGGRLRVGQGGGYFTSAPLGRDLGEKTLQVLVQLDNLTQRGGGALGVQTLDGNVFDSIVFAEKDPGQWLPGSEFFRRTDGVGGPREMEARDKPVWITITYRPDGQIQVFRNASPYGKPYLKAPLNRFKQGQAQAIIGIRHGTPAGNRLLTGWIEEARLFDRALTPEEVGKSIGMKAPPSREEIIKNLNPAQRQELEKAETRLETLRSRRNELGKNPRSSSPLADLAHALFNSKELIYVR